MCSFVFKLNRAYEHLNALEADAKVWVEEQANRVIDEVDPDPPPQQVHDGVIRKRVRVTGVGDVPMRFSILVGDCLFNLRSALDHLALALGRAHTPAMTNRQIKWSEFPIFSHSNPNEETKKIGCIHPDAAKAIRAMQPYVRGSDYGSHPLWRLHELNIIDKHRALATVAAILLQIDADGVAGESVGFEFVGDENLGQVLYMRAIAANFYPIKIDAILLRYGAIPLDPSRDMQMHPILPVQLAVDETSIAREPLIPLLKGLCDFVRDGVIAPLTKFL